MGRNSEETKANVQKALMLLDAHERQLVDLSSCARGTSERTAALEKTLSTADRIKVQPQCEALFPLLAVPLPCFAAASAHPHARAKCCQALLHYLECGGQSKLTCSATTK